MLYKRLICVAASLLLLTSCGKSKNNILNYEQPVSTLRLSMNAADEDSYLCCFLPCEKQSFCEAEDYSADFLDSSLAEIEHIGSIGIKITDSRELKKDEISELEAEYRDNFSVRYDFTKGQRLSVTCSVQTKDKPKSTETEINVVRYENIWYICGGPADIIGILK